MKRCAILGLFFAIAPACAEFSTTGGGTDEGDESFSPGTDGDADTDSDSDA
jgi:hypothetical protein